MRLLVIEDDKELCTMLEYQLRKKGYYADFCYDGNDASFYYEKSTYDVILLDRMLPGIDGIHILQAMHAKSITTPVIMVTALSALSNRIEGLDAGADDYLTKPFEVEELCARIRALERRSGKKIKTNSISFSDFTLDADQMELSTADHHCILSKREYDLLRFFLDNPGVILSRSVLLDRIWGADSFVSDNNLDTFIYFIRKRLSSVKSHATVKTIRSVGYRLEE